MNRKGFTLLELFLILFLASILPTDSKSHNFDIKNDREAKPDKDIWGSQGNGFGNNWNWGDYTKVKVRERKSLVIPAMMIPNSGHGKIKIMPNGTIGAGSNIELIDNNFSSGIYNIWVRKKCDVEINIKPKHIPKGVEIIRFISKIDKEPIRQHFPYRRLFNYKKTAYVLNLGVELKVTSDSIEGGNKISFEIQIK